ncbi:alanyl-tRNA editing protein [Peptostreptococcus sp. D1]|uniref:alanyl-tRNA editing protein n=1 Tax=Peptostreptococcus sp. D1 TaxID=72304 RepID=UPI0008EC9318|nr:alanyl-tRNA editing protein [Peptostreptococcus sp. D1]SFE16165.1 alanyl-tRNA synthetase [Peptostreptococcus sp. D1]
MEKLYYRKRYLDSLETTIKEIVLSNGKVGLRFEEDIVFPGGGGQAADIASIVDNSNKIFEILSVEEDEVNGNLHYVNEASDFNVGDRVNINIDWKHREDNMHQHSGQHVLSGCFYKLFGRNTTGLHIGKLISQLDIEGLFDDEMVSKIELYANEIIQQSIEIENYVSEDDNIVTRRKLPETDNGIRILKIGDLDINACCGIHVYNTSDLKLIKIVRYYKNKNGTRFEYLVGKRAVDFVLKRENVFGKILNLYSCNEDTIINALMNERLKRDELVLEKKYLENKLLPTISNELMDSGESTFGEITLITKVFSNDQKWLIEDLGRYITENNRAIVFIANEKENNTEILLQCSKAISDEYHIINMGQLWKESSHIVRAKGGGSRFLAQGICEKAEDILVFFANIKSSIKNEK